ncbi:Abi family protein [Paenibacillus alkaliterrae]|uniref:Abi family protein n=1 Tax=Paenibacillus alkaliterrae TaxID=320909 RepID=UPI001F232622|nr:Abi family protein [Paenibacillus alkaliterrae]MCF2938352.1 Abi family protein [Paenibacillus alkaliterrae]
MKPFKTFRQQLKILRARGLVINNGARAIRILETENYYSLINGYKDIFLQLDNTKKLVSPEHFKIGVTFEEIHHLFCFDRELRNILIEYLLKFESSVKSKISYRFSEKYEDPNAYLQMASYSRNSDKLKKILQLIATISNLISKNADRNGPIKHYLDCHKGVPIWVLVNYLTVGNIQYFYDCLDPSLQNSIAKDFAVPFNRTYKLRVQFTADDLMNVLKTVTYFRNVCAHEERLYSYNIHKPAKSAQLSNHLNINNSYLLKGNVFTVVSFLKLVISKEDHKSLVRRLRKLFETYKSRITSVNVTDVLNKMGFPSNWDSYY